MTQGTARAAMAVRRPETFQFEARAGAAEKKARRRRNDFAIVVGRGTRRKAAGLRKEGPSGATRTADTSPRTPERVNTAKAVAAQPPTTRRQTVPTLIRRTHQ